MTGHVPSPSSWFAYTIILFYFCFYIINNYLFFNKLLSGIMLFAFFTMAYYYALSQILNWDAYWYASIIPLPLGSFYAYYEARIKCVINTYQRVTYIALATLLLIMSVYVTIGSYFYPLPGWGQITINLLPLAMPLLLYKEHFVKGALLSCLNCLGKYSYEFYLIHGVVIYVTLKLTTHPLLLTSIVLFVTFFASKILNKLCVKIL